MITYIQYNTNLQQHANGLVVVGVVVLFVDGDRCFVVEKKGYQQVLECSFRDRGSLGGSLMTLSSYAKDQDAMIKAMA